MILVNCVACGNELNRPGAILIGAPNEFGHCRKDHLCIHCSREIDRVIVRLQQQSHGTYALIDPCEHGISMWNTCEQCGRWG